MQREVEKEVEKEVESEVQREVEKEVMVGKGSEKCTSNCNLEW